MSTTLPIHTKRRGPFPCKGKMPSVLTGVPLQDRFVGPPHSANPHLTPTQAAWMRENKPLYYTGRAINDLPHLPQHLRFA